MAISASAGENPRRLTDTLLRCRCGINESAPSVRSQCSSCRPRSAAADSPPSGGAAQTIKPQTGRNASQSDPRPARAQREGCPRGAVRPLPSALRHQPTSSSADAKHAVPVVGVGVIAQKEQKIPHRTAVCHSRCCCCQRCQPYRPPTLRIIISVSVTEGFHQGVAMFSVHGVEYAAAIGSGATTENSFPGQIRKKSFAYSTEGHFLRASTQLRPPQPPVASGGRRKQPSPGGNGKRSHRVVRRA